MIVGSLLAALLFLAVVAVGLAPSGFPLSLVAAAAIVVLELTVRHYTTAVAHSPIAIALMRTAAILAIAIGVRVSGGPSAATAFSFVILTVSVLEAIWLWMRAARVLPSEHEAVAKTTPRTRAVLAVCIFAIAVFSSFAAREGLSTIIVPDTTSYWMTPREMISPAPGIVPVRTPLFSLLLVLVQLAGGGGNVFMAVQFVARACAAALVGWFVSGRSVVAGAVIGVLLAIDPVSAATSTSYMTESIFASGLVLVLVLAVAHMTGATPTRRSSSFAAGVTFGCALLIRPTSAGLIALIVVGYGLATRSLKRTSFVAAGYATVALVIALYNYARTGLFVVVATGLYLAFPLFVQHLTDPRNGPASATLSRQLMVCDPSGSYRSVDVNTANTFVYTTLLPCSELATHGNRFAAYELYAAAYREAFLAHPLVFTSRVLRESARFLAVPVSYYINGQVAFTESNDVGAQCAAPPSAGAYPPGLLAFICPVPVVKPEVRHILTRVGLWSRSVYQPYLYAFDPHLHLNDFVTTRSPEMTGAAALLFFVLAGAIARPWYRAMIVGASVIIVYNAAVTAFGQVTIPRYVAPLSPLFLIVTGFLSVSLIEDTVATIRLVRNWRMHANHVRVGQS